MSPCGSGILGRFLGWSASTHGRVEAAQSRRVTKRAFQQAHDFRGGAQIVEVSLSRKSFIGHRTDQYPRHFEHPGPTGAKHPESHTQCLIVPLGRPCVGSSKVPFEGARRSGPEETSMKPVRTFTVTRAGLRDPEPLAKMSPQDSWEQVERLRQLHGELHCTQVSRIQLVVQRRPLTG